MQKKYSDIKGQLISKGQKAQILPKNERKIPAPVG